MTPSGPSEKSQHKYSSTLQTSCVNEVRQIFSATIERFDTQRYDGAIFEAENAAEPLLVQSVLHSPSHGGHAVVVFQLTVLCVPYHITSPPMAHMFALLTYSIDPLITSRYLGGIA